MSSVVDGRNHAPDNNYILVTIMNKRDLTGINPIAAGAGFLPSTICLVKSIEIEMLGQASRFRLLNSLGFISTVTSPRVK